MNHPTEKIECSPSASLSPTQLLHSLKRLILVCLPALLFAGCENKEMRDSEVKEKIHTCLAGVDLKEKCQDPQEFSRWIFGNCGIPPSGSRTAPSGSGRRESVDWLVDDNIEYSCGEITIPKKVRQCIEEKAPDLDEVCDKNQKPNASGIRQTGPERHIQWVADNCNSIRFDRGYAQIDFDTKGMTLYATPIVEKTLREICDDEERRTTSRM